MKMLVVSPWRPLLLPSLKPRPRPNPRLLLSLTTATEATALVDTVDTAAMDTEASTEDTTASVRLRLSPRPLLSPTLGTEVTEDTVLVAMEDTVVTVMAMASKMFPSICDHLPLNHLAFLHSCILTNK